MKQVYITWCIIEGKLTHAVYSTLAAAQLALYQEYAKMCYNSDQPGDTLYAAWAGVMIEYKIPGFGWIDIEDVLEGEDFSFTFVIDPNAFDN